MTTEHNELDLVAQLDQLNTSMENISAIMGNYYQSLIKAGVPEPLVFDLVRDYHKRMIYPPQTKGD